MPLAAPSVRSRAATVLAFAVAFALPTIACTSRVDAAPLATATPDAPAGDAVILRTDVAPGGNFDLSHWSLDEPIGVPGAPIVLPATALVGPTGFHDEYFFTDPVDGAMTFWAPETGVHWAGLRR